MPKEEIISTEQKVERIRSYDADALRAFALAPTEPSLLHERKDMRAHRLRPEKLRFIIRHNGFSVKAVAVHVGVHVRTLERHFSEQFRTTPKAWITHERMSFASPLLAEGLSNKEVAASLGYTCESNFCRDFKQHFGCAPQEFVRTYRTGHGGVAF